MDIQQRQAMTFDLVKHMYQALAKFDNVEQASPGVVISAMMTLTARLAVEVGLTVEEFERMAKLAHETLSEDVTFGPMQ
jgi:hypothetical protein